MDQEGIGWAGLLSPELVFLDMDVRDRHDLFVQLGEHLERLSLVTPDWLERIEERERTYATGLHTATIGIAMPHADGVVRGRQYLAVVRPLRPVTFEAMAGIGCPVEASLVLNLGVTRDGGQVEALQHLMNVFMNAEAVDDIMRQITPEGVVEAFERYLDEER